MDAASFRVAARNIIAVLQSIDPIDVFPNQDQSEQRIRFRQDPYLFFLKADDVVQERISSLAFARVGHLISA